MRSELNRPLLGAACIAANLVTWLIPALPKEIAWFVLLFTLLSHGYLLGQDLFRRSAWQTTLPMGIVLFLGLQSLAQTLWYYAGAKLGTTSDVVAVIAAIAATQLIVWIGSVTRGGTSDMIEEPTEDSWSFFRKLLAVLLACIAAGSFGFVIRASLRAATLDAINTPWPHLHPLTLVAIAVCWLCLVLSIWLVRSRHLAALHGALALLATTLITPLMYRLGFGFDGFLHVASEKILIATGTLSPKPLYYIGQYVFTTWLARLSSFPIVSVDRWLVPIAVAALLPLAILLGSKRGNASAFLALGFLPLAGFIATTPQGFAYVLGLTALLIAAMGRERGIHPAASLIFASWSIATHPLAGVPFFLATLAVLMESRRVFAWFAVVATGAAVPILFFILTLHGTTPIHWSAASLFDAKTWLGNLESAAPWIGNRYVLWPAWATLVERLAPLALLVAAIAGIRRSKTSALLIGSAASLWLAAVILSAAGDFAFLIDYERGNYANRLMLLATFCLIPAAIPGLVAVWERLRHAPRILLITCVAWFVATGTALTYDALPRHDALVTGHGWSTSQYDFEAVEHIDRDAGSRTYVVLANQSVSAAAVSVLGFKRYAPVERGEAGDVFFYPIPTGGPLYETFLRMTYNEPSRDTIKDAAALGKTNLVYVVLNDYWWRADSVAESINALADDSWTFGDNNNVRVYKFDLSKSSSAPTATSTR